MKSILLFIIFFISNGSCLNTDTLTSSLLIQDSDTINSSGQQFTLGFFSPSGTNNHYLGIWYSVSPSSITWVANKDRPLNDTSGTATISSDGNIVVMNGNKEIIWSSEAVSSSPKNESTARLLDSGNLILVSSGVTIWETHKHPGNTFLPTMRLSHNIRTGDKVVITSWRSPQDPRNGNFTAGLLREGIPQSFVWNNGLPYYRTGPWNGRTFTGVSGMYSIYVDGFSIGNDDNGSFYVTRSSRQDFLSKNYLQTDGNLVELVWDDREKQWNHGWKALDDECDRYNKCGKFGICYIDECSCLIGYEPENISEWSRGDWRSGCVRKNPLQCEREDNASDKGRVDGFSRLRFIKVPDFIKWAGVSEEECRNQCLMNCSCLGYAFDSTTGCMYWNDPLIDVQKFRDNAAGLDFYVRVPYTELGNSKDSKVVLIVSVIVSLVVASICLLLLWRIRKQKERSMTPSLGHGSGEEGPGFSTKDLPLYSFAVLASSTNDFSESNKLGTGGFGSVYQGKLQNGQEIAVKRLSMSSGQGLEEFMNEVLVISKLQHRNLVKLLGCCVENGEKMLVYEYLPNGSLDLFIFDTSQHVLDWRKRFNIVKGIGRGLMYLHRDSRLRIIHRDLKPSNILLDEHWYPKISDFGMAKIFGGEQTQANTKRVVGTYGYMAPEYAMDGTFSEKSDIFSFGVLMLEIIAGRRNTDFFNNELSLGLLGYAWRLWKEDNLVELIDDGISCPKDLEEIMRCLWIGLLCVQEYPQKRPIISTVLAMLSSEITNLPSPEHPGFTERWSHGKTNSDTVNNVTITVMEGR